VTKRTRFARRGPKTRVKTAKRRSASSARWLARQFNDPYVAERARRGLRSRAAFKLAELDARFRLLRLGAKVVDLGAAPGGWTQVALERVGPQGRVVALDLRAMEPIAGADIIRADFTDPATPAKIRAVLGGPADAGLRAPSAVDVVLSDMSPDATGHGPTDHLRIVALAEAAFAFAREILKPDGAFVAKVFQGGAEGALLADLKRAFRSVRHAKPSASRAESAETYVVAQGFRGS
jgi:23S rRNA (uridine2552-2'-O)-methyltransferase